MKENTNDEFIKDVMNEKAFLIKMTKFEVGEVKDNKAGLESELSTMIKLYNETLNALVGLRFDLELIMGLVIAEPSTKEYVEQKMKTEKALDIKRRGINIIRGQILKMVELLGGGKKI